MLRQIREGCVPLPVMDTDPCFHTGYKTALRTEETPGDHVPAAARAATWPS